MQLYTPFIRQLLEGSPLNFAPGLVRQAAFEGRLRGSFPGAALIADICDFTSRFESMAGEGAEGAERLSSEVSSTLSGVVELCEGYAGWPVSFAGDAVTLIFPEGLDSAREACRLIREGSPDMLPLRVSLGEGTVSWDVIPMDGWTWYSFQGSAVRMAAGSNSPPRGKPPAPGSDRPRSCAPPPDAVEFMPPELFPQGVVNEFRHVTSIFISVENRAGEGCPRGFQELVLDEAASLGGYVSGLEAGAGDYRILVVFGAPLSREDDADRCDALMEKVFAGASGRVRAGAARGLVFSGLVTTPLLGSYTVLGPSVNLAARLHDAAGWNSVLAGPVFARASRLAVEESREMLLKGMPDAVTAQRLSAWKRRKVADENAPPLLGRQRELAELRASLEGDGSAVLLCGEVGIGKTRLAEELRGLESETEFVFLRCQDAPSASPDVFGRWLEELLGAGAGGVGLRSFRDWLYGMVDSLEALEDVRAAEAADELLRAESVLAALLGLDWEGSLYRSLDPAGRMRNTVAVLEALMRGLGLLGRVVVCVDDFQLMDADSARLLGAVLEELEDGRPPVLLVSRPGGEEKARELGLSPQVIRLGPLGRGDSRSFLEWSLGRPPSGELLEWFHSRTEGIPFFMEHYAGMLESPVAVPDEGSFPGSLHAVLVARLDRLPATLRGTVLLASVLGREFDAEVLGEMAGVDRVADPVRRGVRERVWEPTPGDRYRFVHALVREAAYRLQLHAERRRLHERAAGVMARLWGDIPARAGVVGHHYEQAGRGETAAEWYIAAGRHALSRRMTASCGQWMEKVLELSSDLPRRMEAHRMLYDLHSSSGSWARARAEISRAAAEEGLNDAQRAAVGMMRANLATNLGRPAEALEHLEGLEEADPGLRPEILHHRGRILMLQGRLEEAKDHLMAVHDELAEGSEEERRIAFKALGNACGCHLRMDGGAPKAAEGLDKVLAYAREEGDILMETIAVGNLAVAFKYLPGRLDEAMEMTRKHVQLARRIRSRLIELQALGNLGALMERESGSAEALEVLEESMRLSARYGGSEAHSVALANLGNALQRAGRYAEALEMLERAMAVCEKRGVSLYRTDYAMERVDVLLDMGRLREAEADLEELAEAESADADGWHILLLRGRLRRLQGRTEEASRLLRRALDCVPGGRNRFDVLRQLYLATGDSDLHRACVAEGEDVMSYAPHWDLRRRIDELEGLRSDREEDDA
jgi:tetratricopeptide (TPR) repeat protein